jgi:cell wall-associated NlpC family hydrolase
VFLNRNNTANHAGIYVGNNRFVHAPSTGGVVRLDSLAAKHWASQTMMVRRP